MRFVYWIIKTTDTHSEFVMPLLLDGNIGFAKAPQCYSIRIFTALSILFLHCNFVTERLWTPQTQTSIWSLCFTVGLTRFEPPSTVTFYVKTFRAVNLALECLLSYMHWIDNLPSNFRMWYEQFHYYSCTTAYLLIIDDGKYLKSLSLLACQPFKMYTQVQTIVQLTASQPVYLETPSSKGLRLVSGALDFVRCACQYDYFVTNNKMKLPSCFILVLRSWVEVFLTLHLTG